MSATSFASPMSEKGRPIITGSVFALELDPETRLVFGDALDHAPEALAPVDQLLQLYLRFMTGP